MKQKSVNLQFNKMAGNESNINETTSVDNCDDSNIMNNIEVHSTPNVSQDLSLIHI